MEKQTASIQNPAPPPTVYNREGKAWISGTPLLSEFMVGKRSPSLSQASLQPGVAIFSPRHYKGKLLALRSLFPLFRGLELVCGGGKHLQPSRRGNTLMTK